MLSDTQAPLSSTEKGLVALREDYASRELVLEDKADIPQTRDFLVRRVDHPATDTGAYEQEKHNNPAGKCLPNIALF